MRFIDGEEVARRLPHEMCIPIVRHAMMKLRKESGHLCASRWSAISDFCWSGQKAALTAAAISWQCAVTREQLPRDQSGHISS
jgi:hypothetical protein